MVHCQCWRSPKEAGCVGFIYGHPDSRRRRRRPVHRQLGMAVKRWMAIKSIPKKHPKWDQGKALMELNLGGPKGSMSTKNARRSQVGLQNPNPFKMVTLFGDFGPPSWGAKIIHFEENRLQDASGKRFETILTRDRQNISI